MRVVYVNVEGKMAGAEKSLLLSLDVLKSQCEVVLVCPSGKLSEEAVSRGITWKRLPTASRSRWFSLPGLIYIIKLLLLQLYVLIKYKPDIVHVSNIVAAYAGWMPCFIMKAKLIFHVRDFPKRRLAYRFIGCRASGVIAVSEFIRSCLIRTGIPGNKTFVIYNPLEIADGQTALSRRGKKNDYVYANIGQLVPWKRQILFIEAAKIVAQKQPNTFFWLVGEDVFERNRRYRDYVLEEINNSSQESRIVFKGWQDDITSIWDQINCLVHTAENEPFGRVVAEAMQASVPVVVSNTGGPAEIIKNDVTGRLVACAEPAAFAQAMLDTYSEDKKTCEMVKNAKRYTSENFSQSAISEMILSVYRRILVT